VDSYGTARRNRNVAANRPVSFVLNTDDEGDDLVIVEGEATLEPDGVQAIDNPASLDTCRALIEQYGGTADSFSNDDPHPLRAPGTRVRFR
jgi:hypothetical protein